MQKEIQTMLYKHKTKNLGRLVGGGRPPPPRARPPRPPRPDRWATSVPPHQLRTAAAPRRNISRKARPPRTAAAIILSSAPFTRSRMPSFCCPCQATSQEAQAKWRRRIFSEKCQQSKGRG